MRVHPTARWWCGGAIALALAASATPAAAEEVPKSEERGLALDRFQPAPAGSRNLDGAPTVHAMLLVDYAHNPLVLSREGSGERIGAIVENQLFFHVNGAISLWDRLHFSVDVPVALFQSGDDPGADGLSFQSPSAVQF